MTIRRIDPEQWLAYQKEQEELENKLINGEPVPPTPQPQIQYIPIRGVENTEKQIPWGLVLVGTIAVTGIIVLGIVALCKK